MSIGSKILELRKGEKLSQEKLAEKIGVTRQTISNWELNESSPDLKQAKELSRIFSISLDELVDNDIKDILLDKTNKSNANMHKLNRIMLCILISSMIFLFIMALILVMLVNAQKDSGNRKRHYEYRGVMAVCEIDDKAVFISTPQSDYIRIKNLYESQGGKCYDRDSAENQNEQEQ